MKSWVPTLHFVFEISNRLRWPHPSIQVFILALLFCTWVKQLRYQSKSTSPSRLPARGWPCSRNDYVPRKVARCLPTEHILLVSYRQCGHSSRPPGPVWRTWSSLWSFVYNGLLGDQWWQVESVHNITVGDFDSIQHHVWLLNYLQVSYLKLPLICYLPDPCFNNRWRPSKIYFVNVYILL